MSKCQIVGYLMPRHISCEAEKRTYNFWTREVGGGSTTVVHFSHSTSAVVIVSVVVPKETNLASMADPEGLQGVRSNPLPRPTFLNIQ